ncbi:hypothetical protein D3C72_968350 [compost metagenome]
MRARRVDLDLRRRGRHHDQCAHAEARGGQRHALRMIARRGADDAAPQCFGTQLRHLVVGAAQLEREHRLGVFALEVDLVAQPRGQVPGKVQLSLTRHIVDARGQDALQVGVMVGRGGRGDFVGVVSGGCSGGFSGGVHGVAPGCVVECPGAGKQNTRLQGGCLRKSGSGRALTHHSENGANNSRDGEVTAVHGADFGRCGGICQCRRHRLTTLPKADGRR